MLFSVVIPIFNRSDSLYRAITSALKQDCEDLEIIIIDDGSDPIFAKEILIIVERFNDHRIQLIKHLNNKNGAAARNTGIKHAKGDFICFLDSDDTWSRTKLSVLKKIISEIRGSSTSSTIDNILIHNQYINVDSNDEKSNPFPIVAKGKYESVAHYSFITNAIGGIQSSTICIGKNIARKVLFNESLRGHQDWDFCLRVGGECENIIFVKEALTLRYIGGSDSVASSLDWEYSLNFLSQYRTYFESKVRGAYLQNIVFPKALLSIQLHHLLKSRVFWIALFFNPKLGVVFIRGLMEQLFFQRRLSKLFNHCYDYNYKRIIVWGKNNYTKAIINKLPNGVDVIAVLDGATPSEGGVFQGVDMWSINDVSIDILDDCDALVLATDYHQKSMRQDLSNRSYSCLINILEF